jgi:hypothetical protein
MGTPLAGPGPGAGRAARGVVVAGWRHWHPKWVRAGAGLFAAPAAGLPPASFQSWRGSCRPAGHVAAKGAQYQAQGQARAAAQEQETAAALQARAQQTALNLQAQYQAQEKARVAAAAQAAQEQARLAQLEQARLAQLEQARQQAAYQAEQNRLAQVEQARQQAAYQAEQNRLAQMEQARQQSQLEYARQQHMRVGQQPQYQVPVAQAVYQAAPQSPIAPVRAVCMHPFAPADPANMTEIAMQPGDQFDVYDRGTDGWLTVTRLTDGRRGLIPQNYVQIMGW